MRDQDIATAAKGEHAAAKAVENAADVSTNPRQLREESERWAEYYAHRYGVPVELVKAIIEQESGWNPRAVSKKGAAGLMQLMPETAKRFGVRNRFGVRENIRGGVAYLAWLSEKCNGDVQLMSAAYYGGEYQLTSRRSERSSADVQAYVKRVAQKYHAQQAPIGPLASNYQMATN
jgi:soluble lytic murein transglycosylase-like protein